MASKLKEEHAHELKTPTETEFLEEFKSKGIWEVVDTAGQKEVTLTRKFGNEKISVLFSTDALQDTFDENEMEQEEEQEQDTPVGVSIIIEKDSQKGALEITASAQESSFFIDNVSYLPTAELANDTTAQGDWARRGAFGGPVFQDLVFKIN